MSAACHVLNMVMIIICIVTRYFIYSGTLKYINLDPQCNVDVDVSLSICMAISKPIV